LKDKNASSSHLSPLRGVRPSLESYDDTPFRSGGQNRMDVYSDDDDDDSEMSLDSEESDSSSDAWGFVL